MPIIHVMIFFLRYILFWNILFLYLDPFPSILCPSLWSRRGPISSISRKLAVNIDQQIGKKWGPNITPVEMSHCMSLMWSTLLGTGTEVGRAEIGRSQSCWLANLVETPNSCFTERPYLKKRSEEQLRKVICRQPVASTCVYMETNICIRIHILTYTYTHTNTPYVCIKNK